MANLGHEVVLLAPDTQEPAIRKDVDNLFGFYGVRENFKLVKLPAPKRMGGRTLYTLLVLIYVMRHKPDLVFGRYIRALRHCCRLGVKTIYECHAPIVKEDRVKYQRLASLSRCSSFMLLVTITEAFRAHFLSLQLPGLDRTKVISYPCGGDPVATEPKRAVLKKTTPGLDIGYAGGLLGNKGMDLIAEIAGRLADHDLHIFGGSDKEVSLWREKIPYGHVHFYGYVAQEKLPEYIASLDICLLPNRHNQLNPGQHPFTSPLKMFNYMAQKKAIFASRFPELEEVLNETNSVLLDAYASDDWVDAVERIDKAQIRRIGEQAYLDFMERYTLERRYQEILRLVK
jgi:glycosyltransferase involved in cell wall biosynthesis